MSLVPPNRPQGLAVEAPKGARGGRHRAALPHHGDPRRLKTGGIIGIVAAALVVVLALGGGVYFFLQSKQHSDAVNAYDTALGVWQDAQQAADAAEQSLDAANAALATAGTDAAAVLGAAADGFVGADQKAALATAVTALPAAPAGTSPVATDPAATPSPDPAATSGAGDGAPGADAVLPDAQDASIDELHVAAQALTTAAATVRSAAADVTAQLTTVQQSQTGLETLVEGVITSADTQGRAWLDAFVGKGAPAGQKLDGALTALEQATASTPDRASLLSAYVTWAGPAVPGALDDPSSIYVVVDKLRAMQPQSWGPTDLVTPNVRSTGGQKLRKVAADAMVQMDQAMKAAGLPLALLSCYRSYQNQVATYGNWVNHDGSTAEADTHSARPGFSEHQTGLVCDIGGGSNPGSQAWGATPSGQWAAAHAADYGFILRYDQGKENLSGYIYEPWHFRYVGVATAQAIRDAGNPTLEQWLGLPPAPTYADGSGGVSAGDGGAIG